MSNMKKQETNNRSATRRGKQVPSDPGIQGEGDYISGRAYQKDAEQFAKQHDTQQLAREAAPKNEAERLEMAEAERQGKARAKVRKPPRP
jgi:hypothetical protein